ncbi:MAG: amidohydrolase family protein, partial [Trueperaceae bacterium]
EVLAARADLARRQARVDVGLHVAVGDLDRPRLHEMIDAGAVAFKAMMHAAPPGREASFRGLAIPDDGTLYRALEAVAETGRVLMVHAEHQELIDLFERREQDAGRHDGMAHARSRPVVAEASAVARIASMNEAIGARLHIVHLSSARAAEYVAWFRSRGQAITAETTPAYLFSDLGDVERHGPFVKINPPLRTRADGEALLDALKRGVLDTVASDHAPFRGAEKEAGREDIWSAGSGIPSVELTGPLLWDAALRGLCTFEQAVAWTSATPASLFGLHAAKGHLDVDADADFVLLDPDAETVVSSERLHSRSADAVRHVIGRRLGGRIASVWSRGRIAFDGERVRTEPGDGTVIRPSADPRLPATPTAPPSAATAPHERP